jgi:hypothetical protein
MDGMEEDLSERRIQELSALAGDAYVSEADAKERRQPSPGLMAEMVEVLSIYNRYVSMLIIIGTLDPFQW